MPVTKPVSTLAANEVFPASLAQCLEINSYSYQDAPNVLRTEMDVGPAKVRRRYTVAIANVTGSMSFSQAQVQTFKQFYDFTLSSGTKPFTFTDPVTQTDKTYRFVEAPAYTPITDKYWNVSLVLEILP